MTIAAERLRERIKAPVSSDAVRHQVAVTAGQIAAGVGNMVFSLLMARLLAPGAFAQFASFLALYLLLSLPGSAISAAAALDPVRATHARPYLLYGGAVVGIALAVCSPWVGPLLRLPPAMVVVLGLSGPALGTLALQRGRLYAWTRHAQLVGSLLVEPGVRLVLGLALALAAGQIGGALGVTAGGYAALEVARRHHRRPSSGQTPAALKESTRITGEMAWTAAAFMVLVLIQNLDLLIANRTLSPLQAGQFAVLSTLGGLAVFATMTVPLVLLPRSSRGDTDGLRAAVAVTVAVGLAAVALVAIVPSQVVGALFGSQYHDTASVLVVYMAAMALLGVARVLVAHRCAVGSGRSTVALVALAVVSQASLILAIGHDVRGVALSTAAAVGGLTVSLGTAEAWRMGRVRHWWASLVGVVTRPIVLLVTALSTLSLAERFIVPRGLWLDEATSVLEARLSFSGMITNLRLTDVHPPLYFSVLWVTMRVFGTGELAVRLPSIIAGTLVVPMLYVLGREAYDRRTGMVAAAAGSVAPIMVWYSQEARMYALLMLFGVIALWAQVRIFRGGGRGVWVIYTVASAALVWTQYFGALQVVVQQMAFVYAIWSRHRRDDPVRELLVRWAVSVAVLALLVAPLVPFAYQQFMVNQTAGKGFGGPQQVGSAASLSGNHLSIYAALANVIWAIWGYHSNAVMALLAALWPLGMLFALMLLGRRHRPVTSLLVLAVIGPGVVMFCLGLVKRDLFDIRYLSTAVPLLYVLVARCVAAVPRKTVMAATATVVLLGSLVAGLIDQQYNGANPRTYDFRGALGAVEAVARPGDTLYYDPVDLRVVVEYYGANLTLKPVAGVPKSAPAGKRIFVVASPTLMHGPYDRATLSFLLQALRGGRTEIHKRFSNVEIWEFRWRSH